MSLPTATGTGDEVPAFEVDSDVDASLFALFAMDMLDVGDPRLQATMEAIEKRLWVRTEVGGIARYENDGYHRMSEDTRNVPGNPWFICTLWLAQWYIARAQNQQQLQAALPIMEWAASHALPSGALPEQLHPYTGAPVSVSPLTWSHATVVSTVTAYTHKARAMTRCPTCGRHRQARQPGRRSLPAIRTTPAA